MKANSARKETNTRMHQYKEESWHNTEDKHDRHINIKSFSLNSERSAIMTKLETSIRKKRTK